MPLCALCHKKVSEIEEHHSPIPRKLGGCETIGVCSTCHKIDERLINMLISEITSGEKPMFPELEDPHKEMREKLRQAIESQKAKLDSLPLDLFIE